MDERGNFHLQLHKFLRLTSELTCHLKNKWWQRLIVPSQVRLLLAFYQNQFCSFEADLQTEKVSMRGLEKELDDATTEAKKMDASPPYTFGSLKDLRDTHRDSR